MENVSFSAHKLLGAAAKLPLKLLEKIGVVVKPALQADGGHGQALPQHVAGHHQALLDDELVQGCLLYTSRCV